jgi:hypothetical protein
VGFVFAAMFESNQTWYMQKILLQYIVCAGKLGSMSCCLVWQLLGLATIKTYVYACDFYHWHFCDTSGLTVVGA